MDTLLPAPATAPAASVTHRLRPALIGRPGYQQTVYVPCPPWCVLDHASDRQVAIEDVSHRGHVDFAQVSTMGDDTYSAFELYSQLYSDPSSGDPRMRGAVVVVTDGSNDAYLTPDMADEFADALVAFAEQVRALAKTARGL
jgi:hypothetical protein